MPRHPPPHSIRKADSAGAAGEGSTARVEARLLFVLIAWEVMAISKIQAIQTLTTHLSCPSPAR